MSADVTRLFFALWPAPCVREALAARAAALHPESELEPEPEPRSPTRRIPAGRYHLTLYFLGAHAADAAPAAIAAARRAADTLHAAPFDLDIDRSGSFETRGHVGWLGPTSIPDGLQQLRQALDRALRTAGLPRDPHPDFVPHLTVATGAEAPLPSRAIAAVRWSVTDFVLGASAGGAYRVLARWPLRAPGQRAVGHAPQADLWDNSGPPGVPR